MDFSPFLNPNSIPPLIKHLEQITLPGLEHTRLEIIIHLKAFHFLLTLPQQAHSLAVEKGWYDPPPSIPERIALIHSEASEALEAYRDGNPLENITLAGVPVHSTPASLAHHTNRMGQPALETIPSFLPPNPKPEGFPTELADIIIRVFDLCAWKDIPIWLHIFLKHSYNKTRPHRHGGKKCLGRLPGKTVP